MMAVPAEPFDSPDFSFENKWDGIRALAARIGDVVADFGDRAEPTGVQKATLFQRFDEQPAAGPPLDRRRFPSRFPIPSRERVHRCASMTGDTSPSKQNGEPHSVDLLVEEAVWCRMPGPSLPARRPSAGTMPGRWGLARQ
jgi:hypothetical protein